MNRINISVLILCFFLWLGGCNSAGTDLLDETDPGGSGGGIGGTGVISYSVGTLTGFGSVFINGNRFDTTTASFTVNGQPAAQGQLRVGMQLVAEVDFDSAAADQVSYSAALIGPVASELDATGRLRVLNQVVFIGAGTVLDSLTLGDLLPGTAIEVSGVIDANGELVASYVRLAASTELQLTGTVGAVAQNQQEITVRNVSIGLGQADLSAFNGQALQPGTPVIVSAPLDQYDSQANTLVASSVFPGTFIVQSEDAEIELTGFVQTFDGVSSFDVDGLKIRTSASTQYVAVDGALLNANSVSLNSLIEVEGRFLNSGEIDAQRIVVLPVENTELVGRLEAIDTMAKTVTMFGVPIRTLSVTRFSGDSDGGLNFEALRVGDYVEVDASFTSTGLLATKIEVDDNDDEASLEGPVTQVDANQRQIEIAGISVIFDGDTEFELEQNDIEQEVNEQTFLSTVSVGSIVQAKWKSFSSIAVPVDELEIE